MLQIRKARMKVELRTGEQNMRAIIAGIAALAIGAPAAAFADGYAARGAPCCAPFSWTGFYIGADGGYAWETDTRDIVVTNNLGASTAPFPRFRPEGGFGGGQVGYNWQSGLLVLGAEADIQGGSITDQYNRTIGANNLNASTDLDFFGTVRGRVGLGFDRLLVYGTAGFAYGTTHDHILVNGVANMNDETTRSGWVAGGGIEYAWSRHVSMKIEYQHLDLGGETMSAPVIPPNGITVFSNRIDHAYDTVRVGLNYRFGEDRYVPLK
jgi:outer membrane immunogenic protein